MHKIAHFICQITMFFLGGATIYPSHRIGMVALFMNLSDPSFKVILQLEGEYLANMTSHGFVSNS